MALQLNVTENLLNKDQYYTEQTVKTQIYLHHTAGGSNPFNVVHGWNTNDIRVATALLVAGKPRKKDTFKDGEIVQSFSSKYWAYHLGLKGDVFKKNGLPYRQLDKISVAVEVCNWGQVTKTVNGWETYVGSVIPENEVVEYSIPFRGYHHYQKYTDAQIESLYNIIKYWGEKYNIPTKYIGDKMFDVCKEALGGVAGVYTHVSVREDKNDMHPQPELIEMLKSL